MKPGSYLEQLDQALDKLTDYTAIERAGQMLASDVYGTLVPIGGVRDLGRDGVALVLGDRVHHLVLAVSAQKDWRDKIREVVRRVREAGEPMDHFIYCTPGRLRDDAEFQKLRAEIMPQGVHLEAPCGRGWWLDRLTKDTPAARAIRREILKIPFQPGHFRTTDEFEEQFGTQRGVVLGALVARDEVVAVVSAAVQDAPIVILHGDRGLGKTRVVIAAARQVDARFVAPATRGGEPDLVEDLATLGDNVVVVDDAHARPELVRRLVESARDPRIGRPKRLLLVTWSSTVPALRSAIGNAAPIREVELRPLDRESLSRILQAPPINLTHGGLRSAVLDASGGYPLYAVMGALALAGGADPTTLGTNPLEAYFDGFWERAPTRSEARVMALLAIAGSLRVVDPMGAISDGGREVAARFELSPDQLVDVLTTLAETGLVSPEDGSYVLRPDALAQMVIKRMCFGTPPLADVRVLLELAAGQWDRALALLTDIHEDTEDRRIPDAIRHLLEESIPAADAEATSQVTFLKYVKAAATLVPSDAARWVRRILATDFPEAEMEFLGYRVGRADVRKEAVQIAERIKYRDLARAIGLLLDVGIEEPFEHHGGGVSQRNAPAIDALLSLSGLLDIHQERDIPSYVRQIALETVGPWWRVDPSKRADLASLVLGSLLDPAQSGAFTDPDRPNTVSWVASEMNPHAYAAIADPLLKEIVALLPHATNQGARALLETLGDVVRTALGHARAFDRRPPAELAAAAQGVACRMLSTIRERFIDSLGVQLRAYQEQVTVQCTDIVALPEGAGDIATLFTYARGADFEATKVLEAARPAEITQIVSKLQGESADELALWYLERVRDANAAGLKETHHSGEFLVELGRLRPDAAEALAQALVKEPDIGYPERPLISRFQENPSSLAPLILEWLAGDRRQHASAWGLFQQWPADVWAKAPDLVRAAILATTDDDAHAMEAFLLQMTGKAGAAEVLGLALRSSSLLTQRVAVFFACVHPGGNAHPYHIALNPEDRAAFEHALLVGMAKPAPLSAPQMISGDDTMIELAEHEPTLLSRWVRVRLAALEQPAKRYRDPFSSGEEAGLQRLRGKADTDGLLDDYIKLEAPSYATEGWTNVMRTLMPDPYASVLQRLRAGGLGLHEVEGLLRLVVTRVGWPDLIAAALQLLTPEEVRIAVYRVTRHEGVVTGSWLPVHQRGIDFFDDIAKDGRPAVSSLGRTLAASYRSEYAQEERRERDDEYRRS